MVGPASMQFLVPSQGPVVGIWVAGEGFLCFETGARVLLLLSSGQQQYMVHGACYCSNWVVLAGWVGLLASHSTV